MNTPKPLPVSEEIRNSLAECGFILLDTMAMPYDWIRLKLKHEAKPHPFELDYDGTVESLINAVAYCQDIMDGVLANNGTDERRGSMQQMREDLAALATRLTHIRQG